MSWIKVFAPASIGNIGPGFDVLGLAIDSLGDTVHARKIDEGVIISEITGENNLPLDKAEKIFSLMINIISSLFLLLLLFYMKLN